MKIFIGMSMLTILLLFGYFSSDQDRNGIRIGSIDDEQIGLKDQIIIRFSHVVAENTPKGLAAQKFAELAHEKTKGRVKIEVFPNSILFSDEKELNALETNEVQMIAPSFSKMTERAPALKVLDLPFIFRDDSHVKNVFVGEIGKGLLANLNNQNIRGLAFWSNGFKQMTSNKKALLNPSDFKDQTFRVMPGTVLVEQFKLLNAKPVVTSFNDVYQSLEQETLNGQENTISNIYSKRFYHVQQYLTLSNHGYLGYVILINQSFWEQLPTQIQVQLQEALEETTIWILNESKRMNEEQLNEMRFNSNIKVYELTDQQKKSWKQTFQPLYQKIEQEIGKGIIKTIQDTGSKSPN